MAAQVAVTTSHGRADGRFRRQRARHHARAGGAAAPGGPGAAGVRQHQQGVWRPARHRAAPTGTPTCRRPGAARHGVGEGRALDFYTPYGCSKGAADQYVLDYARSFGLPACVLRMSCIYGPRQMGTEDQGWLAHFLISAIEGRPISIYGDGRQVRDVLFVDDAVEAYVRPRRASARCPARRSTSAAARPTRSRCWTCWTRSRRRPAAAGRAVRRLAARRPALLRGRHPPDPRGARPAGRVGWRDGLARLASWLLAERPALAEAAADA